MTDFSKFMIVSDLDGTFFADGAQLVPRNLEAIARFRAGGGLFTLATGRVELNLYARVPDPAALLSAPAVLCNGAYLFDFKTRVRYFEEFMPADSVCELLALARAEFPDVAFRVAAPGALRIERPEDVYLARELRTYPPDCVEVSPAEGWRDFDWYKIVFRAEPARLSQLRERIEARFAGVLGAVPSDPRILEVQLRDTDKASGIQKLRRMIGQQTRCIITCGDYENDLPMHRTADVAIAPENACESVKQVCDLVLCSNNDGVIADVIEAIEDGRIRGKTV